MSLANRIPEDKSQYKIRIHQNNAFRHHALELGYFKYFNFNPNITPCLCCCIYNPNINLCLCCCNYNPNKHNFMLLLL